MAMQLQEVTITEPPAENTNHQAWLAVVNPTTGQPQEIHGVHDRGSVPVLVIFGDTSITADVMPFWMLRAGGDSSEAAGLKYLGTVKYSSGAIWSVFF